jgi:hypothetical protein
MNKINNRKGSIELSAKSIVILVIAIVVLVFIIFFTKSRFTQVNNQLVTSEPEAPAASGSDPVTVSRETVIVSSGEDAVIKIKVYASRNITVNDIPMISCPAENGLEINPYAVEVQGKVIPSGQIGEYTMKVPIPSTPKGTYICSLNMETDDAVDINGTLIGSEPIFINKDIIFEVK